MSLHFMVPNPSGEAFSFNWGLGRRAKFEGEKGRVNVFIRLFYFATQAGAGHDPLDLNARGSDAALEGTSDSGFRLWEVQPIVEPATEAEELKWCYYGGHSSVGAQDRGRIDRLQIAEGLTLVGTRPEIEEYCTALNMADGILPAPVRNCLQKWREGLARRRAEWNVSSGGK